ASGRLSNFIPTCCKRREWRNRRRYSHIYDHLEDLLSFVLPLLIRACNECIIKSFCSTYTLHDRRYRPLADKTLDDELFVALTGPPTTQAKQLLTKALNSLFSGMGPWNFVLQQGDHHKVFFVTKRHLIKHKKMYCRFTNSFLLYCILRESVDSKRPMPLKLNAPLSRSSKNRLVETIKQQRKQST
uniref:Uncharacterized protein n=1 Tax=Ciona intestinalis TaxID=7719 RepID=H2XZP5_CIOIN